MDAPERIDAVLRNVRVAHALRLDVSLSKSSRVAARRTEARRWGGEAASWQTLC